MRFVYTNKGIVLLIDVDHTGRISTENVTVKTHVHEIYIFHGA